MPFLRSIWFSTDRFINWIHYFYLIWWVWVTKVVLAFILPVSLIRSPSTTFITIVSIYNAVSVNIIQPHDKILCNSYRRCWAPNTFTHKPHDLIEIEAYNRVNTWEYLPNTQYHQLYDKKKLNESGWGQQRMPDECVKWLYI